MRVANCNDGGQLQVALYVPVALYIPVSRLIRFLPLLLVDTSSLTSYSWC